MLSKDDVKNLICDRFWKYRGISPDKTFTTVIIGTQPGNGMLAIRFRRDGKIDFPTNVGFHPEEYRRWDFDEEKQEIYFIDYQDHISRRAHLPVKWFGGGLKMQLISDNYEIFSHEPHVDQFEIKNRVIGGVHMFFTPRSGYSFELFQELAFLDFDLKLIDDHDSMIEFFNKIYQYVIEHPKLETLIISQIGQPLVKLTQDNKLLFANDSGHPNYSYFSGNRSLIIELLTVILSENNKRILNPNDHRNEDELLQDIVINQFADRYEIDKIPL